MRSGFSKALGGRVAVVVVSAVGLVASGCGVTEEIAGGPTSQEQKAYLERWISRTIPAEVRDSYGTQYVSAVKATGTTCLEAGENQFECISEFSYTDRVTGQRQDDQWNIKARCDDSGECIWRGI